MILTKVTHAVIAATALSIPIAILEPKVLFSWHPSFMAVGFLGLMSEGILTSISFRNLEGNDRLQKIWVHLSWQAAAIACIIAGFWTIYENKKIHDKPHFTSVHGKFGITIFVFALLAASGGIVSFRRFGILSKVPDHLQPQLKWAHRNSGLVVWLLALVTIELALTHSAVWKGWLSHAWQAAVAFLGAAIVYVWWEDGDVKGKYERQTNQEIIRAPSK